MSEVVNRLRTEFRVDTGQVEVELARIDAATQKQLAGIADLEREVEAVMRDMVKAEAEIATMGLKVQSGFTNTSSRGFKIDRSAFAPSLEGELHQLLSEGEKRMADPWMLEELERMKKAADLAQPSVEGLARETGKAGSTARQSAGMFGGFKDQLRDSLEPADNLRGGLSMLRENISFFAIAGFGVVEVVTSIANAFSKSDEIAREYGEAVKGLADELGRVAKFNRELREFTTGAPGQTPGQQKLEKLQGNEFDVGEWQKLNDRRQKIQAQIDDLQERALNLGMNFKLDSSGQIADGRGPRSIREPLSTALSEREAVSRQMLDMERQRVPLASIASHEAEKAMEAHREAAYQSSHIKMALDDAAAAAKEIAPALMSGLRSVMSDIDRGGAEFFGLFDQEQRQKRQQQFADFMFNLTGIKNPRLQKHQTSIDARGARINLTAKVETDDPARFADVALKSAFLGVVAKPLQAAGILGAPMAMGGKQ